MIVNRGHYRVKRLYILMTLYLAVAADSIAKITKVRYRHSLQHDEISRLRDKN